MAYSFIAYQLFDMALQLIISGCLALMPCIAGLAQQSPPANRATDDIIIIRSQLERPMNFYYIPSLKGNPVSIGNNMTYKIKSAAPVYLMESSYLQTPFILYPGDTLFLKEKNGRPGFTTKDTIRNHELAFFEQVSQQYGCLRPIYKTTYLKGPLTMKDRDRKIEETFQNRIHFLDQYDQQYKITPSFYATAIHLFRYARINDKLALYFEGYHKDSIQAFYKDSIMSFRQLFDCDTCIYSTMYRTALEHMARVQLEEKNKTIPKFLLNNLSVTELQEVSRIANRFTGKNRDYLLSSVAISTIYERAKKGMKVNIDSLLFNIKSPQYRDEIEQTFTNIFAKVNIGPLKSQRLFRPDSTSITFGDLLKINSGKLIYIDNWATWCLPCIDGIPASKA